MEGTIGEIRMFGASWAPRNWAMCNGETISIQGNEALFSVIGTKYGGDGRTNFSLPHLNLENSNPTRYIICVEGTYPSRS